MLLQIVEEAFQIVQHHHLELVVHIRAGAFDDRAFVNLFGIGLADGLHIIGRQLDLAHLVEHAQLHDHDLAHQHFQRGDAGHRGHGIEFDRFPLVI